MHLNSPQHAHWLRYASRPLIGRRTVSSEACLSEPTNQLARCWPVHRFAGRVAAEKRGNNWRRRQHRRCGAVLWTPETMSRQGRRKTSRSCSTCRFQRKHRPRKSRRSCQGSSKTSTENCAGNIERVSNLSGPLCLSLAQ